MTSSLFLSAMTIVALTGTALVTLKYNHHHEDDGGEFMDYNDSNEINNYPNYQYSPKFNYKSGNQNELLIKERDKHIVKRSSDEDFIPQPKYDISVRNLSMIDEAKREKIKEVKF